MLFTKASEYALLSMIYIAKNGCECDITTISKELKIPKSFLAKIFQNLAKDGILISQKGAKGGFLLVKKTSEISLKSIIQSAEKKDNLVFECSKSRCDCPSNKGEFCQIWDVFSFLQNSVDNFLNNITLENIIKKDFM